MSSEEREQEQRTFLRERFLRLLTSIQKQPVKFTLVDGTTVSAKFGSCDVDVLHIQVTDLETPLGKQPEALLRSTDVSWFTTTISHPFSTGHGSSNAN